MTIRPQLIKAARRWPFTMLGTVTFGFFLLAEVGVYEPGPIFRILVIPPYVMRVGIVATEMMIFRGPPPQVIDALTLPLLFSPYVFLDQLIWSVTRRRRP